MKGTRLGTGPRTPDTTKMSTVAKVAGGTVENTGHGKRRD